MPVRLDDQLASSSASLIKLGRALMGSGEGAKAVALFRRLLAERPEDADLHSAAKAVLSRNVPQWHASMLSDTVRNDCYERAIRRAVRPGSIVLDIGSGSGLLAMMAARAGASHVYTCEANPALAETARDIVAINGFDDRITVIARHSTELDRERDLGGGADVVVSEIFADNLLCEGVLPSLGHAARHLAKPGAQFIPPRASMRVALAYHEQPNPRLPDSVGGFDVSLFGRHIAPHHSIGVGHKRLHLRSRSRDLFTFEFGDQAPPAPTSADLVLKTIESPINGLVQWIRLEFDGKESYENAPEPGSFSAWGAVFHPFPDGLATEAGGGIAVHADHDGENPRLWFTPA